MNRNYHILRFSFFGSYHISGNFHYDPISPFYAIAFTSQNIWYTEIISGIVCSKKILKSPKIDWQIKVKLYSFPIFANLVTKNGYKVN